MLGKGVAPECFVQCPRENSETVVSLGSFVLDHDLQMQRVAFGEGALARNRGAGAPRPTMIPRAATPAPKR